MFFYFSQCVLSQSPYFVVIPMMLGDGEEVNVARASIAKT
jgi:hypothetical protein